MPDRMDWHATDAAVRTTPVPMMAGRLLHNKRERQDMNIEWIQIDALLTTACWHFIPDDDAAAKRALAGGRGNVPWLAVWSTGFNSGVVSSPSESLELSSDERRILRRCSPRAKTFRLHIGQTRRFFVSHGSMQVQWYAEWIQIKIMKKLAGKFN